MTTGIEIVCGVVLLVFGLSYLFNAQFWAESFKSLLDQPALMFPLFLLVLICGLMVLLGHNLWVADWRIIVTVVGWVAVIKSIAVLLFPKLLAVYANWSTQTLKRFVLIGGILWSLFGAYVTYMSLIAR
jgi:hypothetical protein